MKKSITRLIVLVLSLVAILAFAGCELTGLIHLIPSHQTAGRLLDRPHL